MVEIDEAIKTIKIRDDESLTPVLAALHAARDTEGRYSIVQTQWPRLIGGLDRAGTLYKKGNRAQAAQAMGWTDGKRGRTEPVDSIVATYLLQIGTGTDPADAVKNIVKIFNQTSEKSVIQMLSREKKRPRSLPLPSNWQKVPP